MTRVLQQNMARPFVLLALAIAAQGESLLGRPIAGRCAAMRLRGGAETVTETGVTPPEHGAPSPDVKEDAADAPIREGAETPAKKEAKKVKPVRARKPPVRVRGGALGWMRWRGNTIGMRQRMKRQEDPLLAFSSGDVTAAAELLQKNHKLIRRGTRRSWSALITSLVANSFAIPAFIIVWTRKRKMKAFRLKV